MTNAAKTAVIVARAQECALLGNVEGARRAGGELVALMDPLLRYWLRFVPNRGTVQEDDLIQVARIEVLKCLGTFDRRFGGFEAWAVFRVRRAWREQVCLHAADVRPSRGDQFGQTVASKGEKRGAAVGIVYRDSPSRFAEGEDCSSSLSPHLDGEGELDGSTDCTPELLLGGAQEGAQVRAAVARLPEAQRDVVSRMYGIGRDAQSLREISQELRVSRVRLSRELREGLAAVALELGRTR